MLVELADIWLGWVKGGLSELVRIRRSWFLRDFRIINRHSSRAGGDSYPDAMTERSYPREFALGVVACCFRYARNSYPPQYCANCVRICDRVVRAKAVLSRCSARSNTSRIIFLVGNLDVVY